MNKRICNRSGKIHRVLLIPALLLAAGAAFILFGRSESDRVVKTFSELEPLLSQSASENPIASMTKAKKASEYIAPVVRINAPELGMRDRGLSRDDVVRAIVASRRGASYRISFDNLCVRVIGANRASATADVLCSGGVPGFGSGHDVRTLHATLVKDGGRWVFSDVTIVPVVEK